MSQESLAPIGSVADALEEQLGDSIEITLTRAKAQALIRYLRHTDKAIVYGNAAADELLRLVRLLDKGKVE